MKSVKFLSVIAISVITSCNFFAQTATQANSPISTKYSNEEIAEMIEKYKHSHSHDIMPSAELQQKFKTDFPKSYDIEWETDGKIYEVEFDVKFKDYKVYYDLEGNLLMIVQEIFRSELPAVVKNAAETKYPKYNFEDIDKISRGTEIFYKIEMERSFSDAEVKLLVKSDGSIIEEKFDY
ncbi:MAG: PepSY-like domain-containing protein [Prevotellaceae bacterium]|nr:PepSY-like domain-containing protein [Prevotellaceae bacterium]